jgi:hypothetical protein
VRMTWSMFRFRHANANANAGERLGARSGGQAGYHIQ